MGRWNAGWMALRRGVARFGRHVRRGAAAYSVLLLALLLTLLASYYVRQNVEAEARTRFDETTKATRAAIYRRVNAYLAAMFGARGLLRVSDSVGRDEWDGYVRSIEPGSPLRKSQSLEGLQSLGFATYLRPGETEAYSREAREEGVRDLWPEPDGERSAYFPLKLVGPSYEANRKMINYDAYSDPAHRSVMDRARDIGEPQVTGMDYVLTNAPSHSEADLAFRKGFVVYLPVYQDGEPEDTVAERRRALRGFVVGTFKAEELFAHTFGRTFHPAVDFEVYDGEDAASSSLLYDNNGVRNAGEKGNATLFSKVRRIKVADTRSGTREWALYFATLPAFERGVKSNLPAFVLVSGVTVSLLLFGITWMLARSRTQAFRASADLKEANRELEQANTELQRSREGLVSAREEERRRLRRDLHDGVGPQLAALMLELETASDLVSDNPEASALIAKLSKRAREIVSDVRHSVHALRPPALDELGLVEALREGALQYGPAGLRVSVEDPEELSHLPAAVEVACYRIAQEALANVVRHARASHCSIRIRLDDEAGALSVEVEDDGRGIRDEDRAGVGMSSMRERTEELGGRCTVKPLAGGGTLVRALLPFRTTEDTPVERSKGA
ncbi:MAG: CHASE domain-containing protein [Rubrobacteraceae bacterium]|nr:CHASE domain-containing protein [Rubrobacteraceae bacterium]